MRKTMMLLPLALAACNQAETTRANDDEANYTADGANEPASYSDVQQRVLDLPQEQRFGVFLRAIRDGDAPCQGVTQEVRQEDQNNDPVYAVTCADGPVYAISIDRTGTAVVSRVSGERRG